MKYRAKVTYIKTELKVIYSGEEPVTVKDAKDVYAEVDTVEEAELLETANNHRQKEMNALNKLYELKH